MIRRIDLRGSTSVDYRDVVPRAELDVDAAVETVRPICDAVRTRGIEAIRELSQQFDGVAPEDLRVPQEALDSALAELDPAVGAGLAESIARLRRSCEAELEHDVTTSFGAGATVTHRMVPVRRVGLYAPGGIAPLVSSVLMNVVPAQVAGVPSLALASSPQQDNGGLPAADHPRGVRAARRRRGVRRRRGAGDRDVRLRRRGVRAGRPGHRAGQHLHGRCQAAAEGPRRHRLRGRPDRDRDPRRRHRRRVVRRGRPGQPGRARPPRGQRAGDRLRFGWPTRSRSSWTSRSSPPGTPSASVRRWAGSSRASCSSTTSSRASTS